MRSSSAGTACTPGARPWTTLAATSRFSSSCSKRSAARGRCVMALVRIPEEDRTLRDSADIVGFLGDYGIEYERWTPAQPVPADAPANALLDAYAAKIGELKDRGGY